MTPEEEQKLRNFRLLGGGSSMELPQQQQQQQPTAPLLGQAQASPDILSQVPGIGNVRPNPMFQQNLEAAGAAASNAAPPMAPDQLAYPFGPVGAPQGSGPSMLDRAGQGIDNFSATVMRASTPKEELGYTPPTMGDVLASAGIRAPGGGIIGDPTRTEARFGRPAAQEPATNMPQTSAFQTQAAPPLISEGIGQIGGVSPMSQEQGSLVNPMARPQVPSEQQAEAGSPQANFQNRMATGEPLTFTEMGAAQDFAAQQGLQFNPETGYSRSQGIDLGSIERQSATAQEQSATAQENDPIRSTFTLPNGEVVMERESGERFNPTADQLQSFNSTMQAVSQPAATGLGVGGDEGVVFGGGQAPMSTEATQAMLQERFGAPTISAIQSLPAGQGSGMQTDAQGRMIDPNVDRSDFEQASAGLQARIAGRPDFNEPQASQNVPQDVLEAAANPRPTPRQQDRLAQWEGSTQGKQMGGVQGLQPEPTGDRSPEQIKQEQLQNERLQQIITKGNQPDATPFEKKLGDQEQEWQSAQEAGVLKDWEVDALRKDFYRKPPPRGGYSSWAEFEAEKRGEETPTGATGGAGESTAETQDGGSTPPASTFDPTKLKGRQKEAYEWTIANPNDPRSADILKKLGAQ